MNQETKLTIRSRLERGRCEEPLPTEHEQRIFVLRCEEGSGNVPQSVRLAVPHTTTTGLGARLGPARTRGKREKNATMLTLA